MIKKYEIVDDMYIEINGVKLFRIRALTKMKSVSIGDIGGFIESEKNLSHYDDAWVFEDARV
jgi:hypothetical protein